MGHLIDPDGEKDYGDDPREYVICNDCGTRNAASRDECRDCLSSDLTTESDYDPTPWCNYCGARKREQCHCGPLAKND